MSLLPPLEVSSPVDAFMQSTTAVQMRAAVGPAGPDALQNHVPGALDRWRKGLAGVINGSANTVIGLAGTSVQMGAGAGGATVNLARPNAVNVRLAAMLSGMGIPATALGWFGNGHIAGVSPSTYDARLVLTGSWATYSGLGVSAGGYGVRATAAGNIAFSFTGAVDRVVVYEGQYFTAGAYSADIDGTTVITAGQATNVSTVSVAARELSFAAVGGGAHTLNIGWVSGSPIIWGADLYLSSGKVVRCVNCGVGSSTSAHWDINAPTYTGALFVLPTTIAPSLIIFELGINDWLTAVPLVDFSARLTRILTAFQTTSSVIFMTPFPTYEPEIALAVQQTYVDAAIAVCVALGVPFIDEWRSRRSWGASNTLGVVQDSYHPNPPGSTMRAVMMFCAIR